MKKGTEKMKRNSKKFELMFANKIYREGESERERAIVYTIVGIFGVGLFVRSFVWYTILKIYENRLNAGKLISLYTYSGWGSSSWSNFDFLYGFNLPFFIFLFTHIIVSYYGNAEVKKLILGSSVCVCASVHCWMLVCIAFQFVIYIECIVIHRPNIM